MHIWVASWITDDTDRRGNRVYEHMAFADLGEAMRIAEAMVRMVVDWEKHHDLSGNVTRVEGLLDGATYGYGSPVVIVRVDVRSPSSFIRELGQS